MDWGPSQTLLLMVWGPGAIAGSSDTFPDRAPVKAMSSPVQRQHPFPELFLRMSIRESIHFKITFAGILICGGRRVGQAGPEERIRPAGLASRACNNGLTGGT